jgi:uncharacterized protein (DUF1778 family)
MARDSYLNTRLTDSDQALVRDAAQRQGLKPSEFCRLALLTAARRPEPILQTLVEQVEALRVILLNIILHLTTNGQAITVKSLTTICAVADAHKVEQARRLFDRATQLTPEDT